MDRETRAPGLNFDDAQLRDGVADADDPGPWWRAVDKALRLGVDALIVADTAVMACCRAAIDAAVTRLGRHAVQPDWAAARPATMTIEATTADPLPRNALTVGPVRYHRSRQALLQHCADRADRPADATVQHLFGHASVLRDARVSRRRMSPCAQGCAGVLTDFDAVIGGGADASGQVMTALPADPGLPAGRPAGLAPGHRRRCARGQRLPMAPPSLTLARVLDHVLLGRLPEAAPAALAGRCIERRIGDLGVLPENMLGAIGPPWGHRP